MKCFYFEVKRLIDDEGFFRFLKISFNIIMNPKARTRILEMRKIFRKYQHHLNAIVIIAEKNKINNKNTMNITKSSIIGELVAEDYRTASIFKKHKIDFCCNGNRSIDEVCEKKDLQSDALIAQLEQAVTQGSGTNTDFTSYSLDLLADYVEKKHHRYVEAKVPEIIPFLDKIVRVHGDRHPELIEIAQLFKESAGELSAHMKKEELILFPLIRKLVQAQHTGTSFDAPMGSIQHPIETMMHEHDGEGEDSVKSQN
jgi:regulator of cell morphogenesis and NO signaling